MTLYLRNKNNNTLVDIECWINDNIVDISCVIDIKNYSLLLLEQPEDKQEFFIREFDELSELRGWLHEVYFMATKNTAEEKNNVIEELKIILKSIGDKYNLHLVCD